MSVVRSIFQNRLFRDFSVVFGGTFWSQLINFGFFFVYPFLYPEESFAYYGVFMSTLLIVSSFINLKMNNLVMIVTGEEEKRVVHAGIKIGIFLSILMTLIFIVLPIEPYLIWAGICLFGVSIRQPLLIWLNKKGKYKQLIFVELTQIICSGILSLLVIYLLKDKYGLIYGYTIGMMLSSILILFLYPFDIKQFINSSMKEVFSTHWKFNTFVSASSVVNTFSRNSIVYILYYFFSSALVGQFVYVQKLIQVPKGIYTQSLSKIFYKEVSQTKGKKLKALTKNLLFINIAVGLLAIIAVYIGSFYFEDLFKKNWTYAPTIIKYMIFWVFVTILVEPISSYLEVRYKVEEKLYYNIFLLIIRAGSVLLASAFLSFVQAILVFSLAGAFCNLVLLIYILKEINGETED